MGRLLHDFPAFSKPRPLEARAVDVAKLIGTVGELIGPEAEAAHVQVAVEASPGVSLVRGDPRAPASGAPQLDPQRDRGHARARRTPDFACPKRGPHRRDRVEDDGPGFPKELPAFDAFFTTKVQGTGLGLSLAHRIVSDHGGAFQVQSRPGKTCFTVALPVNERS